MKITSESPPKFDVSQRIGGLSINQDCFLYLLLLLFRDNSYSIACKSCLDRQSVDLIFGACSAISTKRLIDSVRHQDYSEIFHSEFVQRQNSRLNMDLYLHVLLQTICLILGIPLLRQLSAKTNNNSKISQSTHSIFLFLEDRLPKSSHVLKIEMSQNLHLETLVRLFRRRIKDVPFPHLLRIVIHAYKTSYGKFIQFRSCKQRERRSIEMLLQNFYTYEIDSILLNLWTRMRKLQPRYFASPDRNNVIRKKKCVSRCNSQLDAIGINHCLIRSLCIHFGRYENKSIIVFHGTNYFVKKWIRYISTSFKSHFHYPTEFIQIRNDLLSTSCVLFLGYISTIQSVSKDVQIETMLGSCNSISSGKKTYPGIPILQLVKLLEKGKFCDSNGYPVSKLAWAMLTDDDILNRFTKIWNTFSSYHSASINRDGLRRLRYIPRLSCDSTLAGKHKSTIRLLRRRFDLELPKVVPAYIKFNSSEMNRRVWHLNLIRSVSLTFISLEIQVQ
uniref:Maturase K n=1 Tax=Dryopteris yoroii TaxID=2982183 RepID=A0A977SQ66_9MONI|nr:maturase K [Dryopteris yoroii]UXN85095.1 maturase K [Dryopteris yoroii]UXN85271.1 maturase K [Dryopteris yoroii]UXN85359.1 maturase K [Dryopteris yoroii]